MLPELSHLSINWQNGMKIRTDHFVALDNHIHDSVRDAIGIFASNYNYGLLPSLPDGQLSLKLQCEVAADNEVEIELLACRAVTAGGVRIEKREEAYTGIRRVTSKHRIEKTNDKFDIIVHVDPFSRIAVGEPDPKENPPRRPSVMPNCELKVVPHDTPYNSISELKIGELEVDGDAVRLSEDYTPPCSSVDCYIPLFDIYRSLRTSLKVIDENSALIVQKLRSGYTPEGADTDILHDNFQFLVEQIVFFSMNSFESFRRIIPKLSPLYLIEYFARFARVVDTVFRCIDNAAKQSLLNYFRQWGTGFEPGNFEDAVARTLNIEYDHQNIRQSLETIRAFLNPLAKLFEVLPKREFVNFEIDIIQEI